MSDAATRAPASAIRVVATACQLALRACFDSAGQFDRARLEWNLAHTEATLRALATGAAPQLFVLPQFSVHGFSMGRKVADWVAASATIPGPETDRLGRLARDLDAWIAGTLFERHAAFPGRHFLTGFLISPAGDVVLCYRKLYAFSTKTRPGDVYHEFVAQFGRDALFPVASTPFGRVGMAIAGDVLWPEVTRSLALRGAEIILNPTGSMRAPAEVGTAFGEIRRVRAYENVACVVFANVGPLNDEPCPAGSRWPSQIIDHEGRVLAEAADGGESHATATLDIGALRAHRATPMRNLLAQLQPALHAPDYADAQLWPLAHWAERPLSEPRELFDVEAATWRRMRESGRFE
jgi:predicted amidohydrolase